MSMEHVGNYPIVGDMKFARGMLLLDDCEGTYNWANTGTGGDFAGSFETTAGFFGTKGLKMLTKSTTPAENDYMQILRKVPLPEANLVVWRMLIRVPDISDVTEFRTKLIFLRAADWWEAGLKWTIATPKLEHLTTNGAYIDIPGLAKTTTDGCWYVMELVVDLVQHEYVSALMFGRRVDLSGATMRDVGSTTFNRMEMTVRIQAAGANIAEANLDSMYCGEYRQL